VSVPSQDLDFHQHMSWSIFTFSDFNCEVIVRFVDISRIIY
jgi:hypothetical protein